MRCQSVADVLREGWFPQFGSCSSSFFFNDTATTEIYTLSLHDALPIYQNVALPLPPLARWRQRRTLRRLKGVIAGDRKSTRLNSSHGYISYAVFCLKKKRGRCTRDQEQ